MGKVILQPFISLDGTDYSAYCEEVNPSWDLEIQESRPFSSQAVKKDAGMKNNSFQMTIVDDDSMTFAQFLNGAQGTKVGFVFRYDSSAKSATNPEWTGNVIVPPMAPPAKQGDEARYTVTLQVDGSVAMATA